MGSVLKLAGRAAIWRTTSDPRLVGLPSLLLWTVALALLRVAFQFLAAGPHASFNPYGLNAIVAWLALELVAAALVIPAAGRITALSAMVALMLVAEFILGAASILSSLRLPVSDGEPYWLSQAGPMAIFVVATIWWMGAMVAVIRSFAPKPMFSALGRVAALWGVILAATVIVPHAPVFIGHGFDIRGANVWEFLYARYFPPGQGGSPQNEAADFEQSQQALLQAEVAQLALPKQGATSIYAIGIAGWADQDVFLKELDGGLAAIGGVLPIRGRTLRLVNHRETTESMPLANQRNFAAAVHAVSEVMAKNDDILLLLMTSHGTPSGFALRLPDAVTSELTPQEVAQVLDKEGIKNRVVIISACYAGIFLPPLANDDTIVLTAADAQSTSFGCAPERDWTYFGDAFFRQSLRRGWDFQHALDNARILISGWEMMDRAPPSNPQGHFGPALVAKLAPFFAPASRAAQ